MAEGEVIEFDLNCLFCFVLQFFVCFTAGSVVAVAATRFQLIQFSTQKYETDHENNFSKFPANLIF